MSFLDKMKSQYGSVSEKAAAYNKSVAILKNKIENAFKEGKTCCAYFDTEDTIKAMQADPEFEGFTFKESKLVPSKEEYKSVLVCWD